MKANEIFANMPEESAASVFQYLRDEERAVYAAALSGLATNRKLRPVFVQKKPVAQQIAWMVKNVKLKASKEVAENVLQLWLIKGNTDMLTTFLDGMGIEHDGEGAAEDIPDELDAKKLKSTVDQMLKDYDGEKVKIYLHTFQMQRPEGWQAITDLIESTPALQWGEAAEAPAEEKKEAPKKKAPAKKAAAEKEDTADDAAEADADAAE